jgi:RNA polymerase primary sigma factor
MITISYADRMKDMSMEDKEALSESANRWGRQPRLTREEVIELAKAKDAGDIEARNKLVEHNMQLVIRIARGWVGRGVPFEDLIQEGAIGLMRAADLYDWTVGEFSTFAGLRIVSACQRAIENQGDIIRIPVHTRSSGLCAPEVERAKHVLSGDRALRGNRKGTIVSDAATIFGAVFDKNANTEDEALLPLFAEQTAGEIAAALFLLNPQERQVIEARYLSGNPELVTFTMVGQQLGITKQRVEQVQKTAFVKLRAALSEVEHAN